ncbi:MAG: hypothetical protein DWQ10_05730 [Calditrichaeota bacterium]|nr:MAG: hypothetical protein DWQ10_05730 [Calditrichota bacterium]
MNGGQAPLEILKVIKKLEIGPVKVERKRFIAPYKVVQNHQVFETELIYSYEENVFDPAEPASRHLANMIAAQVAMNYGLFCEEIVFHGEFGAADQKFIEDMTENTANEIYVMKFLEPNPFLVGDAKNLRVEKREKYSQARLEFTYTSTEYFQSWDSQTEQYAILSSGGKDSLLSFALMDELGYETHPIFGNESGRHWFTALNAFRHFKANIPNTARVWMNSDRVFAWMLRHLPFVRQDFASVRADIYPIRLWTVAVFLFGVLPLLRKRGIGNLLIGDEYDSTWTGAFQGIPHYEGLYDQSRYFDDALTLYFQHNKWGIHQFSILRPLSEMLILRILVSRYPALQAHQVSCHAAHKQGERIHPCGKCEKCRRIIGMLTAFGADATRCGYTTEQIASCLDALAIKSIHQEAEGIAQLLHMLVEQGKIELSEQQRETLQSHPEILNMRFHPENSPIDYLPDAIRKPLLQIFLQYAIGGLQWREGQWHDVKL